MFTSGQVVQDIKTNKVIVFMKGMPGNSNCGFSTRLVTILDSIGVTFKARNVLESDKLRQAIKAHTGVPTLPQLFVRGHYVGGSDDIRKMYESDTLISFFENKSISTYVEQKQPKLILNDISKEQIISCAKAS